MISVSAHGNLPVQQNCHSNGIFIGMKRVGYWKSLDGNFADPNDYVVRGWDLSERIKIIKYLRSGYISTEYTGLTFCCMGCKSQFGLDNTDLTDGEWEWPANLVHYVESHQVKPADDFINHIKTNGFKVKTLKHFK